MLRAEANRLAAMIVDIRSNQTGPASRKPSESTQKRSLFLLNRPPLACLSWPKNLSIQTPQKALARTKPLVRPLISLLKPSTISLFGRLLALCPVSFLTFCYLYPPRMGKEKLFSLCVWLSLKHKSKDKKQSVGKPLFAHVHTLGSPCSA